VAPKLLLALEAGLGAAENKHHSMDSRGTFQKEKKEERENEGEGVRQIPLSRGFLQRGLIDSLHGRCLVDERGHRVFFLETTANASFAGLDVPL
jgi:hypothetical protein